MRTSRKEIKPSEDHPEGDQSTKEPPLRQRHTQTADKTADDSENR